MLGAQFDFDGQNRYTGQYYEQATGEDHRVARPGGEDGRRQEPAAARHAGRQG
jgi:hypothetical protein